MASLTAGDKQFFINRIRNELSKQIEAVRKNAGYDRYELLEEITDSIAEEIGVKEAISEIERLELLVEESRKKIETLNDKAVETLKEAGINSHWGAIRNRIENEAERRLVDITAERFPKMVEKVAHLEKIKYDSEAVIRMVTTTSRLQNSLTKLFDLYHIELEGLENFLPQE